MRIKKYWIARKTKTSFKIVGNASYGFYKTMENARQRQADLERKTGKRYIIIQEWN